MCDGSSVTSQVFALTTEVTTLKGQMAGLQQMLDALLQERAKEADQARVDQQQAERREMADLRNELAAAKALAEAASDTKA